MANIENKLVNGALILSLATGTGCVAVAEKNVPKPDGVDHEANILSWNEASLNPLEKERLNKVKDSCQDMEGYSEGKEMVLSTEAGYWGICGINNGRGEINPRVMFFEKIDGSRTEIGKNIIQTAPNEAGAVGWGVIDNNNQNRILVVADKDNNAMVLDYEGGVRSMEKSEFSQWKSEIVPKREAFVMSDRRDYVEGGVVNSSQEESVNNYLNSVEQLAFKLKEDDSRLAEYDLKSLDLVVIGGNYNQAETFCAAFYKKAESEEEVAVLMTRASGEMTFDESIQLKRMYVVEGENGKKVVYIDNQELVIDLFEVDEKDSNLTYFFEGGLEVLDLNNYEKLKVMAALVPVRGAEPVAEATAPTAEITEGVAEAERKKEIAKNINDYLNSEGNYTLENIQANHQYFFGETDVIKGILPLGMIRRIIGQFILIDANYDFDSKLMHLYLGTIDAEKNRVVFDYNFLRDFVDESVRPPVNLIQERTSLYAKIATGNGKMLDRINVLEKWNKFIEENRSKPISIDLFTTLMTEEWGNQNWIKEFDSYLDLRIALFNQLPKFGQAVGYLPTKKIGEEESKEYLKCMWTKNNFKGIESLSEACPSDYGIINIYIRRP